VRPQQFAIVVRDIPNATQGQTKKEQVDAYFKAIYPEAFYRSMIVTDNKVVRLPSSIPSRLTIIFLTPYQSFERGSFNVAIHHADERKGEFYRSNQLYCLILKMKMSNEFVVPVM